MHSFIYHYEAKTRHISSHSSFLHYQNHNLQQQVPFFLTSNFTYLSLQTVQLSRAEETDREQKTQERKQTPLHLCHFQLFIHPIYFVCLLFISESCGAAVWCVTQGLPGRRGTEGLQCHCPVTLSRL